jgi:serine/threonine-protein kinase
MLLAIVVLASAAAVVATLILTRDNESRTGTTAAAQATRTDTSTGGTTAAAAPSQRDDVSVPELVGLPVADALASLRRAGFEVRVVTVPGHSPAGSVLAQHPGPDEAQASGSVVQVNVSDGTQGSAAAQNRTVSEPTTTAQAPTTTSTPTTTDTAGQSAPTPVASTTTVPSLSGDVKSAVQRLAESGLRASIQYVPGDEPLGTVRAQAPSSGRSARRDAHVTVSVSSGPGDKEQRTVPDTLGETIPEAVASLNDAGLRLILLRRVTDDRSLAGRVIEQTPAPGATAPNNAQILVYMGAYEG